MIGCDGSRGVLLFGFVHDAHTTLADRTYDVVAPDSFRRRRLDVACGRDRPQARVELLDLVQDHIDRLEVRIKEHIGLTESMQLVKSLPGVGPILAIVITLEVGSVDRFPSASCLASYSGTVPKVQSSGGKVRHGRMIKHANNYLKWAFIEAANVIVMKRHHPNWRRKHVSVLYERIRRRKGHAVAVGAVARHLAEATFWILNKNEPYRDPMKVSPKQGQARG